MAHTGTALLAIGCAYVLILLVVALLLISGRRWVP